LSSKSTAGPGEGAWTRARGWGGSGSTKRSARPGSSAAGTASPPTLRKWWRRYQAEGEAGLETRSHRPQHSLGRKVFADEEALILCLRRERKFGIKMLRNELARRHGLKLALDTIHKVLVRHGENQLKRPRLRRKGTRRYSRPVPGDRVQMDTCKIRPGLYQYTAIDDCSRWQVLGLYPRRTAADTLDFLDRVAAGMPFPPQRVQTDLDGEVERGQRTMPEEFWAAANPGDTTLAQQLEAWRTSCNRRRPLSALGGRTPAERIAELTAESPTPDAIRAGYHPDKGRVRRQSSRYRWLPTNARVT
jgi:transposase-like protein